MILKIQGQGATSDDSFLAGSLDEAQDMTGER
jgi:hypothetical protein